MKTRSNPCRILRICMAAVSFCFLTAAVLYPRAFPRVFLTQAGSDGLAVIGNLSIGAGIALASIVLLTLLLGRLYCSVLCPLGILQDILGHFHIGKYRYTPWKRTVRLPVFCLVAIAAALGFMLPLTLLMPSSNVVLIINAVFREIIQLINDGTDILPEPMTLRPMPGIQLTGWFILLALTALVQWRGRLFCNTLCPVGAVLALLARKSFWRVAIDPDQCVHCGACEKSCKASCIDSKHAAVHNDECVLCLDCLGKCPKNALKLTRTKAVAAPFQASRRAFLANGGAAAAGFVLGASGKMLPAPSASTTPVMPPGAVSRERFSARCLGCGLCIGACTGKALKASITEYGLRGFQQPVLDPYRGACDFSCNACSSVCPCGALLPLTLKEKQTTRIGIAHWESSRCVAFVDDEDCGACSEHCPVGALTMEDVPGHEAKVPQVNAELCIGCGACQNICPIRPIAAITVQGVTEQCNVKPPQPKESTIRLQAEDDFPF